MLLFSFTFCIADEEEDPAPSFYCQPGWFKCCFKRPRCTCCTKPSQALHGLAPKCKLINMHELINKSKNDYVTLLPCENGANVNNKG